VTPEGKVKVLDFGLAKAFGSDGTSEDPANSPTVSMAATMHGVILGTAAYMSPEQARGNAVDKRTDLWAFGCVLYELLTGKQAFEGEMVTDIIAKILQSEPHWKALPPATPAKVSDLLRRCLQKDKTLRMQAAGDARIEIQEALIAPSTAVPVNVAVNRLSGWRRAAMLALTALASFAIGGIAVWNLKPAPASPPGSVSRMVITLPPGDQLAAVDYPAIAISPDGTQLAYVAVHSGTRQIYLRALDSLEARPLPATEGGNTPFFSPDGQRLGFFAGGKLKRVSVSGGEAVTLANAASPRGATWGIQGTIVFAPAANGALQQVSDAGHAFQPLTRLDTGEVLHRWPQFLPGEKAVLFAVGGTNPRIAVQYLGTGRRNDLVSGGTSPRYAPSGHLIYAQGGTLMAAPFDPQRLRVTGSAMPVVAGVLTSTAANSGGTQYSISATGSLAYVPGSSQEPRRLVWVDRKGTEQTLAAPPHIYGYVRLSPDGQQVAVDIAEHQEDQIWLYDLDRETLSRWTFEGTGNRVAAWTPDGRRIAFLSNKEVPQKVFWQLAEGSRGLERLTNSEYPTIPGSFSSDGQLLAFTEINPLTGYDVWVLRLNDHKAEPFLRTPFNEAVPSFSRDGHWLAYISDESGRYEVYVQAYPGPGGKYQISTDGGTEPVWNPNGKELFYRSGDKIMAVGITTQPGFSAGKPRVLFAGPYMPTETTMPSYDVSPDGQRFLMIKPSEQNTSLTQIVVVQNWFEELKLRVPNGTKK
jgi:Tol biopolymer transport system component